MGAALLVACGPPEPAVSSSEGSAGSASGAEPPRLLALFDSEGCDGVRGAVALDDGGFLVAGESGVINGWLSRYDSTLDELWSVGSSRGFRDLALAPDGSVWVAAGSGGQAASIERFDLDGTPLPAPAELALDPELELSSLTRLPWGWLVGGRRGASFPFDAWLAELDSQGAALTVHPSPMGEGNVGAGITAVEQAAGLAVACGSAASGEWGWPWLLFLALDSGDAFELEGEQPQLGVRSCRALAVGTAGVAYAESGELARVSMLDSNRDEVWGQELDASVTALRFMHGELLLEAGGGQLRARELERGELLWSLELDVEELRVRELVVLAEGSILVAGDTPGDVGECSESWLAVFGWD